MTAHTKANLIRCMRIDLPRSPALVPLTDVGAHLMRQLTNQGDLYDIDVLKPRSQRQLNKFWGTMGAVAKAVGCSADELVVALKREFGLIDFIEVPGGLIVEHERSIALRGGMGAQEFAEFYERCILFILERILPGVTDRELAREVEEWIVPRNR